MNGIAKPNTKIYASIVKPGMVIRTEAGERVEVEASIENYSTFTFGGLTGQPVTVAYGETVELLGYFNL